MSFANPLPWWALPLVAAAIAAVAWLAYRRSTVAPRRRMALIALRAITLFLLVLFLMRPVRTTNDTVREAVVPILVDASRSMSIEDADGRTRLDRAREIVTGELMPLLGAQFHVELFAFGDGAVPVAAGDLAPTARRSDLSGALAAVRERFRGRPTAGIIVLSDGGDTGGADAVADGMPPVFAFGLGSPTVVRDREVLSVTAAEEVFDDSRVDLAVSAVSHGYGAEPIALRLLENGRPIEVRRVTPSGDGVPVHETFQVSPGRGAVTVYSVEIPAGPGELVPENNSRSTLVQPPSRTRRVLFVEGAPGFEHSFLKRAWGADPGLEIDSIVRKGKNEQGSDTFYIQASRSRSDALTSGYPQRPEDLFAYDALVLANVEAAQLTRSALEATRAFVAQRGGGLLVLGARSFGTPGLRETPLEPVLPLQLSDRGDSVLPASTRGINRVALTAAGEVHPVMRLGAGLEETRKRWEAAPTLASAVPLGGPRPGATVLAVTGGSGGTARALVAVQRYGEGRSMVFTGEAAWRWRMLLPSTDKSYDTFWRQAVRWLALSATDPVALSLPAGASPGDSLSLRLAVRDAAFVPQPDAQVDLRVTAPDGRIELLRAAPGRRDEGEDEGRFVARFRPEQPGIYRVSAEARRGSATLGSASASLLVGGSDLEMTDPRLNLQVLQRLALGSGGRMVAAGDGHALLEALHAGIPAATLAVTHDLWHTGWSFAGIVLLLFTEWML
ncbi:MAG: glutamine amidotransferase, partial [Acidobacteriota bacterium]